MLWILPLRLAPLAQGQNDMYLRSNGLYRNALLLRCGRVFLFAFS
ncbi:MAG: hypothetical protein AAB344_05380 [Bacteroidota bacterium]